MSLYRRNKFCYVEIDFVPPKKRMQIYIVEVIRLKLDKGLMKK